MEKDEFRHLIEFEINRLDVIITSLQSSIIQIKLAFIASILAVILSLNLFVKDAYNLIDVLVSLSFFIAIILFIYSSYQVIISRIIPKIIEKPIVKNVSYHEVLKKDMADRRTYLSNILGTDFKLNLIMQLFFGFSMISPFIWPSLGQSIWDKSILWVSYFLISDVITLFTFSSFFKKKTHTDFLFDKDTVISDLRKSLTSIKKIYLFFVLLILVLVFLYIVSYLYFWFILTTRYILFNIIYLITKFKEMPLLFLIVFVITLYFIDSINEYINYKYRFQILSLKQNKYREMRRELYEAENPNLENLLSEFKLNAPW